MSGILYILIIIIIIVSNWKIFEKAGRKGWESLIPIYNVYVLLQIVGKPGWWLLLLFIPFINIIVAFYIIYLLAKSFGKGVGFALGLIFLGFIFYPILAFGDAKYLGPPEDEVLKQLEE